MNRKKLAAIFYRKYFHFIDAINRNALLAAWIRKNHNSIYFSKRSEIYRYVVSQLVGDNPIDLLEFGVASGNSLRYFAKANQHPDSRFVGFDSFEGLPADWRSGWGKIRQGSYSNKGIPPRIDDHRVSFVIGLYQDTLSDYFRNFSHDNQLVIHIDCDLYSSALYIFTKLDEFRSSGPFIIMDDFSSPLHVFRAFDDYVSAYSVKFQYMAAAGKYYDQVCVQLL